MKTRTLLLEKAAKHGSKSTKKKRVEDRIPYLAFLDGMKLIAVGFDIHGKGNYASPSFLQLTGYTAEEVLGSYWFESAIACRPRSTQKPTFNQLIETAFRSKCEAQVMTKSGETRLIAWNNAMLRDSRGIMLGMVSIGEDITDRKRTEEVLQFADEHYQTIVDSIGLGVVFISPMMEILKMNKTMKNWFPHVDVESRPLCYRSFKWQPHDEPCSPCPALKTLQDGNSHEAIIEAPRSERIPACRMASSPLRNADNKIVAVVNVIEDLTVQRQMRERLIQSQKLATVGELISGVAHELNNPLTAVVGYAQMLQWEGDLRTKKHQLGLIKEQAFRCSKIVQNLLTFARKQKPEKTKVDINEIVRKTLDLKAYDLRVSDIEVCADLDAALPYAFGDFNQLQQVFVNVITNAEQAMIEANNRGKLSVRSRYESAQRHIVVEIEDNGPGIPEGIMPKIFDTFFTTKEPGKGTGLGLSVSREIIQDHQGEITVSSEVGKGALFAIRIPAVVNESSCKPSGVHEEHEQEQREQPHEPHEEIAHVLVIDDEPAVLNIVATLLKKEGYRVDTVSSGEQGLQKLCEKRYSLLICDIRMPGMEGERLYSEIKQRQLIEPDRILFMTGDVLREETAAFISKFNGRVITKPFDVSDFQRIVKDINGGGASNKS